MVVWCGAGYGCCVCLIDLGNFIVSHQGCIDHSPVTKIQEDGKNNCQEAAHGTKYFHFLPVAAFHHVYKEVCTIILQHVCQGLFKVHQNWASTPPSIIPLLNG